MLGTKEGYTKQSRAKKSVNYVLTKGDDSAADTTSYIYLLSMRHSSLIPKLCRYGYRTYMTRV